jgi:hypothetical protein
LIDIEATESCCRQWIRTGLRGLNFALRPGG